MRHTPLLTSAYILTNDSLPLAVPERPAAEPRSPIKWHLTGTLPVTQLFPLLCTACNLRRAHAAEKQVCIELGRRGDDVEGCEAPSPAIMYIPKLILSLFHGWGVTVLLWRTVAPDGLPDTGQVLIVHITG